MWKSIHGQQGSDQALHSVEDQTRSSDYRSFRFGTCPEDATEVGAGCTDDADCVQVLCVEKVCIRNLEWFLDQGQTIRGGNGVFNGTCDRESGSCLVEAWCPIESDQLM